MERDHRCNVVATVGVVETWPFLGVARVWYTANRITWYGAAPTKYRVARIVDKFGTLSFFEVARVWYTANRMTR